MKNQSSTCKSRSNAIESVGVTRKEPAGVRYTAVELPNDGTLMAEERGGAGFRGRRRRLPQGDWVVGTSTVLGAILGASAGVFGPQLAQAIQAKPVDETIVLSPLRDVITADDPNVDVKGELKADLPSGKQLWVAARQTEPENHKDNDVDGEGLTVYGLCDVQPDRKFDCGSVRLAGDHTPGHQRFVIFVGTADSGAAIKLMEAYVEQERDGNYVHKAPRGFDAVPEAVSKTP